MNRRNEKHYIRRREIDLKYYETQIKLDKTDVRILIGVNPSNRCNQLSISFIAVSLTFATKVQSFTILKDSESIHQLIIFCVIRVECLHAVVLGLK